MLCSAVVLRREFRVLTGLPSFCSTAFVPHQLITSAPLNVPQRLWSKFTETTLVGDALSQNKAPAVFLSPPPFSGFPWSVNKARLWGWSAWISHFSSSSLFWKQWCLSQTSPDPHIPAWFIRAAIVPLNGLRRYCHRHFPPLFHWNHNITSWHACFSQNSPSLVAPEPVAFWDTAAVCL